MPTLIIVCVVRRLLRRVTRTLLRCRRWTKWTAAARRRLQHARRLGTLSRQRATPRTPATPGSRGPTPQPQQPTTWNSGPTKDLLHPYTARPLHPPAPRLKLTTSDSKQTKTGTWRQASELRPTTEALDTLMLLQVIVFTRIVFLSFSPSYDTDRISTSKTYFKK